MEYLRKLKWDIWGAKFMAHLHKRYTEVKTMSETDKNIAPEVVGKTDVALKDEKVLSSEVKIETSK
ncbi:hypothetical protein ASJ81_10950 [Methanosarcina spelaei]|uniref:Uncharacterized protein n=1 Tax=Methanosarcina spelaei TaxID=1036679 RepID=A0A2A2HPJ8_9EURY|nr:hypothetical protein [Methanosarcina spelaei]PAV11255.1 hypothetical protein ASJ81_10950 [Methanosarcina spelaei]